ncbi:GNAT family N-acetyltransferase [Amnibacterium setariae]|uniref:N-acetyltransferase n=1 Tax=Amnibacterium setariae TaxID=2306585 RepID=A0A3A1TY78_9MICO|nr:GNAT family N-acetyltransferase [Amnibacterium setariae]RIX28548.1 N-acetyltransferase [Amnibacterium setariae]
MTGPAPAPTIAVPDPTAADDEALVARLASVVNAAYAIGEAGMWRPGTPRVDAAQLREDLRAGRLLVARAADGLVGVVRVQALGPDRWGFGMLAVDPAAQGGHLGAALVGAAEAHVGAAGATTMQLELLVPIGREQPSKERLRAWYSRLGYRRVGEGSITEDHPELADALAEPCAYEVWQRALAPAG